MNTLLGPWALEEIEGVRDPEAETPLSSVNLPLQHLLLHISVGGITPRQEAASGGYFLFHSSHLVFRVC